VKKGKNKPISAKDDACVYGYQRVFVRPSTLKVVPGWFGENFYVVGGESGDVHIATFEHPTPEGAEQYVRLLQRGRL